MMDIQTILKALLRNWWIVVLAVVITGASTGIFALRQQKIYQASTTVELQPSLSLGDNQMINIISVLSNKRTTLNTFARKATSGTLKSRVAQKLGIPYALIARAEVVANVLPETTLIEIRAKATDPELAASMTDAIARELVLQAPDKVLKLEIIDFADIPSVPIEPQVSRLVTLGIGTGLVLGLMFALLEFIVQNWLATRAPVPAPQLARSTD